MQSMMTDLGSCLDRLQRSQRDLLQEEALEDQTCGLEMFVPAGGDQIGKSGDEARPRRANFGGPLDEGKIVA